MRVKWFSHNNLKTNGNSKKNYSFLYSLNDEDRFLFIRRYWYADSVSDLSAMTGGSPNRVSLRLFRVREKLKKRLIKEGFLV